MLLLLSIFLILCYCFFKIIFNKKNNKIFFKKLHLQEEATKKWCDASNMFIEKYISFCKEDHSRYSVPTNIEELQGNYEENEYDLFIKTAEGRELYLKKFEALITYLEFHPACIRTRSGDLIKGISLDIDEKLKDRAINLIFL